MTLEDSFEVSEELRKEFIETNIVGKLPEQVRSSSREKAIQIVNSYAGVDRDALSILAYAAERERFDEFAEKLEKYYQKNLQFVHPDARKELHIKHFIQAQYFFITCYDELGIKKRE